MEEPTPIITLPDDDSDDDDDTNYLVDPYLMLPCGITFVFIAILLVSISWILLLVFIPKVQKNQKYIVDPQKAVDTSRESLTLAPTQNKYMKGPKKQGIINPLLIKAMELETEQKYEEAARIYEGMELWYEARRCRSGKSSAVDALEIDLNLYKTFKK